MPQITYKKLYNSNFNFSIPQFFSWKMNFCIKILFHSLHYNADLAKDFSRIHSVHANVVTWFQLISN